MKSNLKRQLSAWSAEALSYVSTRPGNRKSNWPVYAAAAGAALASTTNAAAGTIVYSGIQNVTDSVASVGGTVKGPHGSVNPALNGPASSRKRIALSFGMDLTAVQWRHNSKHPTTFNTNNAHSIYGQASARGGSSVPIHLMNGPLAEGAAIGPGAQFSGYPLHRDHIGHAQWNTVAATFHTHTGVAIGQPELFGFERGSRVRSGLTQAGYYPRYVERVTGYGWIQLEFGDSANGIVNSITAIDWAYTTDGSAVTAGETGSATPEPGTGALGFLAMGASAVIAWRRRRTKSEAAE